MSRRGSKRRQIVQLDASSSNLHRYGYSKSFMSSDRAASSLKLLGDYSDSESEESVEDAENVLTIADSGIDPIKMDADQGSDSVNGGTAETEIVDESRENGSACMDDKLKNFLSEIDAIPMPADLQTGSIDSPQEIPSPAPHELEEPVEPAPEQTSASPPKKTDKKGGDVYSMFIKGDTEFADHSSGKGDCQVEQQRQDKNLDIPKEPTTQWQLVKDEATQYYYYWNWNTNEVTWEIPADYTQYLLLHKEYEEKISKYTPEQIETFKGQQQQEQNLKSSESKPVSFEESSREILHDKIGPQLSSVSLSTDHKEEQSFSGHGKKKKRHKKHKRRRHKDEEYEDETEEPMSKSSISQAEGHKQLPQLVSIVPYLSDEESENKDILSSRHEHFVSLKDTLSDPLLSKRKEHDNSVDSLTDLNAELEILKNESPIADDNSETDQIIRDIPSDRDASDTEGEEVSTSTAEILTSTCGTTHEIKSSKIYTSQANIANLNSEDIEIFPPLNSVSKDEDKEKEISENSAMSEKDENLSDCEKTEQAVFLEIGKQEVEEGEISDSCNVTLKMMDADKSLEALQNVESQTNPPSTNVSSQGKSLAGTLLNLIDYKSDSIDEEGEDEEEEGELRECISPLIGRGNNKSRDYPLNSKEDQSPRDYQGSSTLESNSFYSQEGNVLPSTVKNKICEQEISSSHLPERNQISGEVDDTDIDFDDMEDIDRVLEMALEKKLDKRKVDDGSSHLEPSTTCEEGEFASPVRRDVHKQFEDMGEEMSKDKSKGTFDSVDLDDDLQNHIKSMADLALNKLDFLEVGASSLSKLQILYVELQTRIKDWNAGGLSTNYIYHQLQEAERLIEQYEVNAVPDGWLCQWDRTKHRYFYQNTMNNQIQLEYPQSHRKTSEDNKNDDDSEQRQRERLSSEVEESHRQHASSRSSRHRKKEDKERSKHDRRSSDRHRKKRRRRRNHSSSSNSSNEIPHQHHHKGKRKKKRKPERSRSPSVEVMEYYGGQHVLHIVEDSPPPVPSISPALLLQQTDENSVDSSVTIIKTETDSAAILAHAASIKGEAMGAVNYSDPDEDNTEGEQANPDKEIDGVKMEEEEQEEGLAAENGQKPEDESSTAIISKPPQIIVPPYVAAINLPELYSSSRVNANTTAKLSSQLTTSNDNIEELQPKVEDSDKVVRKRKKDKAGKEKILATGSSLMMKKKRVSSMVQKWQQVKKEVEKEDLAKEMRQAAIRQQIDQLK